MAGRPPVWLSGLVQLLLWVLLRTDSDEGPGASLLQGAWLVSQSPVYSRTLPSLWLGPYHKGVPEEFPGQQVHAPPIPAGVHGAIGTRTRTCLVHWAPLCPGTSKPSAQTHRQWQDGQEELPAKHSTHRTLYQDTQRDKPPLRETAQRCE